MSFRHDRRSLVAFIRNLLKDPSPQSLDKQICFPKGLEIEDRNGSRLRSAHRTRYKAMPWLRRKIRAAGTKGFTLPRE
jgi:hypothetical protein